MAIRVGELNRRSHAPDPPDRPTPPTPSEAHAEPAARPERPDRAEPTARPDSNGRAVSPEQREMLDRLTGVSSRRDRPAAREAWPVTDPATAKSEIAELKARRDTDKAEFARQPAPDRPDRTPALDAAHAKIAELEKQVSTLESDKAEVKSQLDASNARIDTLNMEVDALRADRDKDRAEFRSALTDMQDRLERLVQPEINESHRENPLSRVDAPTGAVTDGNPIADEPKTARNTLRASAYNAAAAGTGVFATVMSIGPHVPAYVLAVGASVAGAVSPAVGWYRDWRKAKNANRPEG